MHKLFLLIALLLSQNSFARLERCENIASGENVVSPDGLKTIARNANGFQISSPTAEGMKVVKTIKALHSTQRWQYLWSEDSRFLKAERVSATGGLEAVFVVDFKRDFVVYPYAFLTHNGRLEKLTKVSLMGDEYLLARYGSDGIYEILSLDNGRVMRSTLPAKMNHSVRRLLGPQLKIAPGDLPETL